MKNKPTALSTIAIADSKKVEFSVINSLIFSLRDDKSIEVSSKRARVVGLAMQVNKHEIVLLLHALLVDLVKGFRGHLTGTLLCNLVELLLILVGEED